MLAVPVCIYVLSLSTYSHLYTFMYTPSLSTRPIYHIPMLAVPVCIYVLSFSTYSHLYTFMYTPSLSTRPIYHTPK